MTPHQQVAEDLAKLRRPRCTRCRGLMLTEPIGHAKCHACKADVRFNTARLQKITPSKWDKIPNNAL